MDGLPLDALAEQLAAKVAAALRDEAPAPLLDAEAAAAQLGVPSSWVLAEARADRIPHVRLGRYVRFDATELVAWWQTRRRGPWRTSGAAAGRARTGSNPVSRQEKTVSVQSVGGT